MDKQLKKILPLAAIIVAIIAVIIIALPSATPTGKFAQNEASAMPHVKIGYVPLLHALPIYMAMDKNYFTQAGIDAEMVKFESPNQMIDAIMLGKIEFISTTGASGISAVADNKNPGKIKLFALSGGSYDNPNEALLVKTDSTITQISDLNGKKLGILAGTIQWRTIAKDMLAKNNLTADKDTQLVELAAGVQVQALANNQVDAVLALEPVVTIAKQKGIAKEISHAPMEHLIANPFYPGAGVISTSFAQKNPETAKKVIEVINKAILEADSNMTEARAHLKNWTALTEEQAKIVTIPKIKTCNEITAQDLNALQTFYDIFTKFGVVEGKLSAEAMMYCHAD